MQLLIYKLKLEILYKVRLLYNFIKNTNFTQVHKKETNQLQKIIGLYLRYQHQFESPKINIHKYASNHMK